jgi:hypothetical protein
MWVRSLVRRLTVIERKYFAFNSTPAHVVYRME